MLIMLHRLTFFYGFATAQSAAAEGTAELGAIGNRESVAAVTAAVTAEKCHTQPSHLVQLHYKRQPEPANTDTTYRYIYTVRK